MGSEVKITMVELLESVILVERSPDKVISTHKIAQEGPALNIVELEALSSTVVTTRNRRLALPPPSAPHLPSGMEKIESLYFHSIYTDGSWTKTYSLPSLLLNSGSIVTGGAIVLHTNRGLLSIKVDIDVEVNSAFDAEVISLLIAHEMASGRRVDIWSDCSSAIKCLNGGGLGSYLQLLSGWTRHNEIKLCKVKAHPELRLPASEWSKEEQGNFLADKIAGGLVTPHMSISAKEWLKWIGSKSKIIITDSNSSPVIIEPRRIKSKLDSARYLQDRDNYRIEAGKTPCWKDANIALHHSLMGRSKKIGDRVITQRIGLIKRWQWHSARKDNICAGCNQPITGIDHPLRYCNHAEMIKARSNWWKGVDGSIMKCKKALHERLFAVTRAMRETPGGEIACCGSFLPNFVASLQQNSSTLSDREVKSVLRILKTVSGGARTVLRASAELQLGLCGINWRQPAITQFFKPSLKTVKTRIRRPWGDNAAAIAELKPIRKARITDNVVLKKNKDITVQNVFNSIAHEDKIVYWEFKAG
jgi:hypothetical protein